MKRLALVALCASFGCDRELSFGRLDATVPGANNRCEEPLPELDPGDGAPGACGTDSAGFHFAMCSCEALVSGQALTVDGFDSRRGSYRAGEASGAVGLNDQLSAQLVTLGGSLIVGGANGIPLGGDLTVGGHLSSAGPVQNNFAVQVDGDARIAGAVRVPLLEVGGTLYVPNGVELPAANVPSAVRGPVTVVPPCSCAAPRDIAAAIEAAAQDHDEAPFPLAEPGTLKAFAQLEETLPCGRYYFDEIYARAPLTLRITGNVALHVRQRVIIDPRVGALTITLADDAQLDLFIGGGMSVSGPLTIGGATTSARVRIYVGGGTSGDNIFFAERTQIGGSLYAPRSELVTGQGPFELYGAALVRRVAASGPLSLHYDRALAGDRCAAATCSSDADCVTGLRCDGQQCLP